jgi:glutamyl-tRNA synthetase
MKKRPDDGKQGATRLIVPDRDISFCDGLFGMQTINLARQCGDFILQRADKAWAYQLAVVTDDALMGITEVVRGRDLLLSVPQQMYLYELLGYKAPAFTHIPLLCNEAGQRLSKRDRSLDMEHLRKSHKAEEIIGFLAYHAKLIDRPEPISLKDLQPIFSWKNIPTEDIIIKEEG